jgi:hypothetical protein
MQSGACFAVPLGELKIKNKKWRQHLKNLLPSAMLVLTKTYPAIPLTAQSNLVRRNLSELVI